MQASFSLILNVLLLVGVVIAIARLMKLKRLQAMSDAPMKTSPMFNAEDLKPFDDIIAVRKINIEPTSDRPVANPVKKLPIPKMVMLILQAKNQREFVGYELLQTVLAAGLRFGDDHLFHRHERSNGQGHVLCSLAAATETGTFDLQNIGAFSVKGLCIFMQVAANRAVDEERFNALLDTARHLAENLDAQLLDDKHVALSEEKVNDYLQALQLVEGVAA